MLYLYIKLYITSMKNRKILTLNEILSLDRRPTLQEMVDLSIEDYTKYLFEKGIIKYIPESGSVVDYEPKNNKDYYPFDDIVLRLKDGTIENHGGVFECCWDKNDYFLNRPINESTIKSINESFYLTENNLWIKSSDGREFKYSYLMDGDGDCEYWVISKEMSLK